LGLERNLEIIENNYYDNFDNFLDQDHDPYFYVGDFRKKDSYNFGSDSDILFWYGFNFYFIYEIWLKGGFIFSC